MGNGLDKTPFIQGTHKMLRICHHLFHNFLFSPTQQKKFFQSIGVITRYKMCVLWKFEIAIGAMEKVPTFIEIHWKMLVLWKFGSEITCCLRVPLMERTFDMKSQEHDSCILPQRNSQKFSIGWLFKCHHSYFTLPFCISWYSCFLFSLIC